MDDVSKRIGISKRTLYTVVSDKETLFVKTVDYVFVAIKESEKEIVKDTSIDIVEKLSRILIVLPQQYKTIDFRKLYDLRNKYPHIYAKIENRLETQWEDTFAIMEQAMEQGRIRKISFPVFQAIVSGTIEYYLSRSVLLDSQITYEEALQQMLYIILNGIVV
jgi:AcrR family transcriptional regulator